MTTLDLFAPPKAHRMCIYTGYSFGLSGAVAAAGYGPYLSGVVITPRYVGRLREAGPLADRLVLDNGAYPAWHKGEPLTYAQQLDGLHEALAQCDPEWIIAPDVVADARASLARTVASLTELAQYGTQRLLLAIQDGMDVDRIAGMAREMDCGVFVGGSGWPFKHRTLLALKGAGVRWVHVGRINSRQHIALAAAAGADASDSTSYVRKQTHNVQKQAMWRRVMEDHAHRATPRPARQRDAWPW